MNIIQSLLCTIYFMLKFKIIIFLLFSVISFAKVVDIDEKTSYSELLSSSKIYIDETRSLSINEVFKKKFKENEQQLLGYGYSPNFDVWIEFSIRNNSDETVEKIIEYENPLATNIFFYSPDDNYKGEHDGLFFVSDDRKTINPTFRIKLNSNETKIYYIKASSYITTLILKLNLWSIDAFFAKEIRHQFILALFFGSMTILGLYNLFIYFFTKDISYFYYVLYIFGIIFHHFIYIGMANVYLIDHEMIPYLVEFAAVIVAFPIFALGIFTKSFLGIARYPKLNFVLNIFLILIPLSLLVFISTDMFNKFRNIFSIILIVYLIYLTIYTAIKKNRQSYFILFGWVIIASAGILMYLSSAGVFNIYLYYPYVVETSFVIEAIIFSIALADRIKQLQKEKEDVNLQLISQQNSEKQRLEEKVKEKTSDLKKALDEKGLLLKELNHRVKNNMQTIVSLIRLQADEIDDVKINEVFLTIQNRINAMGHLHEMLYKQDNITHIDAREYFSILIDELKESYENNIGIFFDIKANLKMEEAIYCGLILNELVTNSFKYAFPDNEGTIYVSLEEEKGKFRFCIEDDGIGYVKDTPSNSLGLILVDTLARKQLKGEIFTNTKDGVKVMIVWK